MLDIAGYALVFSGSGAAILCAWSRGSGPLVVDLVGRLLGPEVFREEAAGQVERPVVSGRATTVADTVEHLEACVSALSGHRGSEEPALFDRGGHIEQTLIDAYTA